jgi:hypothetical protein
MKLLILVASVVLEQAAAQIPFKPSVFPVIPGRPSPLVSQASSFELYLEL